MTPKQAETSIHATCRQEPLLFAAEGRVVSPTSSIPRPADHLVSGLWSLVLPPLRAHRRSSGFPATCGWGPHSAGRSLRVLLAAAAFPLLLLCGCSENPQSAGDQTSTGTVAQGQKKPEPAAPAAPANAPGDKAGIPDDASGEPIIVAMPADAQKLDPPQPTSAESFLAITHIYDRLVEFDTGSTLATPGIASAWHISPDGLHYTFDLRDNATFSDGSPVDAEAVKFTFDRIVDEKHPQHYPGINWTHDILGDWFDHIEVKDPRHVEFVLKQPFSALLQNLSIPAASIVSPKHTIAMGPDKIVNNPLGSGPYVLDEWKTGSYIKLKARPDHWRAKPVTQEIYLKVQPDMNQAFSGLKRGDNTLVTSLTPAVIGDRKKLSGINILEVPLPSLGYVAINCDKPNLKSKALRQALNYAIDRQSICDGLLEGTSIPAGGILPPGMLGYDPDPKFRYSYDPDKAKKLITDNHLEGTKIVMHCFTQPRPYNPVGTRLAQRLQEDFRKIGLDIELKTMDFGGFLEFVDQRTEHELALSGWMSDTGDPDNFIYYLFASPTNRSNYKNPKAIELMTKAGTEIDPEKRAALYQEAEQVCLEDPPCVVINHAKLIKGVSERLKNYTPHPVMVDRFYTAYIAK